MKENIQVMRSREWIYGALTHLMESKDFHDISISEIANKAGVARLTIYRNFASKEDILINKTKQVYKELMEKLEKIIPDENAKYLSIREIINIFDQYSSVFELLLRNNLDYLIMQAFESEISNILASIFGANNDNKYEIKFYEGAFFAIAVEWVKNNQVETIDELTQIIFDLVYN